MTQNTNCYSQYVYQGAHSCWLIFEENLNKDRHFMLHNTYLYDVSYLKYEWSKTPEFANLTLFQIGSTQFLQKIGNTTDRCWNCWWLYWTDFLHSDTGKTE